MTDGQHELPHEPDRFTEGLTAGLQLCRFGLALVLRGGAWVLSYFLVGPVLGLLDLPFPPNAVDRVGSGSAHYTATRAQ